MPLSCFRLHYRDEGIMHHILHTPRTCRNHCTTKLWAAPGVEDTGQASTPTQQQPSTVGGSMTSGEGTSLQSSPSLVPPARLGGALHRQRLVSSQPEGSEESGSVSSNSSHLVPARFQAGLAQHQLACNLQVWVFARVHLGQTMMRPFVTAACALETLQQRQLDLPSVPCRP